MDRARNDGARNGSTPGKDSRKTANRFRVAEGQEQYQKALSGRPGSAGIPAGEIHSPAGMSALPGVHLRSAPNSRTALPPAARFASFISEYLREKITPSAPALRAAAVAAWTSSGEVFFSSAPVGISTSMPG